MFSGSGCAAVGVKRSHQCQSQALHTFMLDQSATQAGDTDSARPDEAHLATIREGHGLVLCVVPEECITRSCGVAAFTGVHCTMVLISSSPVDPDGRGGYTAVDLQVNQLVCAYTGLISQSSSASTSLVAVNTRGVARDPGVQGGFAHVFNCGHGEAVNMVPVVARAACTRLPLQLLIAKKAVRAGAELLWDYNAVTNTRGDGNLCLHDAGFEYSAVRCYALRSHALCEQ